jgi:hypothetical protein
MPLDAADKTTLDALVDRFTYHPPSATQIPKYQELRAKALELAALIVQHCPSSAERSSALSNLDVTVMLANAAIARHDR